MRVDLRLQCFQLIFFQCNLIDIYFIDQTVDLIHHPSEAVDQNTNLVFRITADCNLPASMVHLIHVSGKFFNLSCKNPGKRQPQNQRDQTAGRHQRNFFQQQSPDRTWNCPLTFVEIKTPVIFFTFCHCVSTFLIDLFKSSVPVIRFFQFNVFKLTFVV